jgi:hypothetical protein
MRYLNDLTPNDIAVLKHSTSIPGAQVASTREPGAHNQGMMKQNAISKEVKMNRIKTETISGNIPEKKFSTGTLSATVWQNQGKSKTGEEVSYRTVSFQRRYMDQKGEWQTANSLRINDLPKASLVLQKAYEYLVIKEMEDSA